MLGFKNQVIGNYGMVHVYFHELLFIISGICKWPIFYEAFSSKGTKPCTAETA